MSISTLLDYRRFYELHDPMATRPLRLETEVHSDFQTSEQAWQLFRGQLTLEEPLRLRAYMGGQTRDFLWTSFAFLACISSRTMKLLTNNGITGWSVFPVDIFGRKNEPLPDYHGFSVIGSVCHRDRSRSQIIEKPATPYRRSYAVYRGLYFNESQWDGSDIFLVRRFGGIVVTERVYHLFLTAEISNVRFTPLPEVEIDVYLDEYEK